MHLTCCLGHLATIVPLSPKGLQCLDPGYGQFYAELTRHNVSHLSWGLRSSDAVSALYAVNRRGLPTYILATRSRILFSVVFAAVSFCRFSQYQRAKLGVFLTLYFYTKFFHEFF